MFCMKVLKCITKFWNKCYTSVILIKFWLCFFCPDLMFYFLHAFVIGKELTRELHKNTCGSGFPLATVIAVFFYQISKKFCNNQIGLKIVWFHLEINYDTGIKHPAQRNIGLWRNVVDNYINHRMGFFSVSEMIFDYIVDHGMIYHWKC